MAFPLGVLCVLCCFHQPKFKHKMMIKAWLEPSGREQFEECCSNCDVGLKAPRGSLPRGLHSGLPGGRPDGVFFRVSVLFAHLLCKEKGWNRHLLGCSDSICVFKAEAETSSTFLFLCCGFLLVSFLNIQTIPVLLVKTGNKSMSIASTKIVY